MRFDPAVLAAKQQDKQTLKAHKQANPSPNSVPVLAERVKLLEKVLEV